MVKQRKSRNSEGFGNSEESVQSVKVVVPRKKTNGTVEDCEFEAKDTTIDGVPSSPKSKKGKLLTLGQLMQQQSNNDESKLTKPSGASLAVQVTQGLMSNDTVKLDDVLREAKVEIIQNTLLDLQVSHVVPLLKALFERISCRSATNIKPWILWIQCILSLHASYLASIRNLETELSGLLEWMRLRVGHQQKLLELHGKLSIVGEQIERRVNRTVTMAPQPLIVFNDDVDSDLEDVESGGSDESAVSSDEEEEEWWDESGLGVGDEYRSDDNDESDNEYDLGISKAKVNDDGDGCEIDDNSGSEQELSGDDDRESSEDEMDIG